MALPAQLVYNDLSGDEIKHILQERFAKLLDQVPYLQKHLTLPRVRMKLEINLETWADQPTPERQKIHDTVDVLTSKPFGDKELFELSDQVDASPKGEPPDKIREEHGLGIPTPIRGKVAIEDRIEGRRVRMDNGTIIDRTGQAPEYGREQSTVIVQDFGVAGLAQGKMDRQSVGYRNNHRDGGPVEKPHFRNEDK